MTTRTHSVPHLVTLEYVEADPKYRAPGSIMRSVRDPDGIEELRLTVHREPSAGQPPVTPDAAGPFQVELEGTSRALENLGTFLIALARLEGTDDGHIHLSVRSRAPNAVHLIVRRAVGS